MYKISLVVSILFLGSCTTQKNDLSASELKTWLKKNPAEIGCNLEQKLGYKDAKFNCSTTNYTNNGDPCNTTEAYYEGVEFPNEFADKIHPSIESINLDFEHGNLREVSISFKEDLTKDDINKMLALPENKASYPKNIQQIVYGENTDASKTNSLNIIAFDHIGAGEVDCD